MFLLKYFPERFNR